MKRGYGVAVLILAVVASVVAAQHEGSSILEGQYLGQTRPGTTPEVFAPGIISTKAVEACLCFSHDDRLLVFRRGFRDDTEIFLTEQKDGTWTEPTRAPFFDKQFGFGDFTFSPNEPVLYFTTDRPLEPGQARAESANLWKVEYENGEWLQPIPLGRSVNSPLHDSYPSVTKDKTLFFFRRFGEEKGLSEIMYSEFNDGDYSEPIRMGKEVNTQWDEWDPSIAPDGSFLVYCSKKPSGFGQDDLFVSFRTADGGWTEGINLGDKINSDQSENRPFITADGTYLFYNSSVNGSRDVFWVDLSVVQQLRPEHQ